MTARSWLTACMPHGSPGGRLRCRLGHSWSFGLGAGFMLHPGALWNCSGVTLSPCCTRFAGCLCLGFGSLLSLGLGCLQTPLTLTTRTCQVLMPARHATLCMPVCCPHRQATELHLACFAFSVSLVFSNSHWQRHPIALHLVCFLGLLGLLSLLGSGSSDLLSLLGG